MRLYTRFSLVCILDQYFGKTLDYFAKYDRKKKENWVESPALSSDLFPNFLEEILMSEIKVLLKHNLGGDEGDIEEINNIQVITQQKYIRCF
jgi:hypothetical protein